MLLLHMWYILEGFEWMIGFYRRALCCEFEVPTGSMHKLSFRTCVLIKFEKLSPLWKRLGSSMIDLIK